MNEYSSRWEYLKNRSPWHFDKQAEPTADWSILGRFVGDWQQELAQVIRSANGGSPLNFLNKLKTQKKPYTYSLDKTDMSTMGLPDDAVFLYRILAPDLNPLDCPKLFKMIDWFGLEDVLPKIHIQHPGQIFPLHIDDLTTHRGNQKDNTVMDEHPEQWARFEIQLKDWTWGHVWGIGNDYWKQWSAGDIMYHPWWIHPHGTANFGMEPRINLQLTGRVTERTLECLAKNHGDIPI